MFAKKGEFEECHHWKNEIAELFRMLDVPIICCLKNKVYTWKGNQDLSLP